jgi:Flp pilus assembly protein TadG
MPHSVQPPRPSVLDRFRQRYLADTRGNILLMTSIMIPVVVLALGGSVDYISATRREETVDGIADAAALAATTPAMMTNSCVVPTSASCTLVVNQVLDVFNAQIGAVNGIGALTLTAANVSIVDSAATPTQRTATVTWSDTSANGFAGVLGYANTPIGGQSVAKNSNAPVTDFYMLLDESPSMAFPAQTAGVTAMANATPNNNLGNCALGCHQSDPTGYKDNSEFNPANVICQTGANALSGGVFTDGSGAFPCVMANGNISKTSLTYGKPAVSEGSTCAAKTYTTGAETVNPTNTPTATSATPAGAYGAEDAFALSRCLAVQLRVDLVNQATTALMTTAPATATENNTTYAVNIYTLDLGYNNVPSTYNWNGDSVGAAPGLVPDPAITKGLETVFTWPVAFANIDTETNATMVSGFTSATTAANGIAPLESNSEGDDSYSFIDEQGLKGMYGLMPTPGNGGSAPGDTPQEVLFIVTDGLNDSDSDGTTPTKSCIGATSLYTYYGRPQFCVNQTINSATSNSYCTDIKNKGIRIAFLYLRYNSLAPYDGYVNDIEPWQYPSGVTGTDEVEQAAIACASTGLEFTVDTDGDITTAMQALFQKAVQTAYLAH